MQVSTIGLDTSKRVFQVHGVDVNHQVIVRKQLKRAQVLKYFAELPPCLVGIEACAASHYWGREIGALGHEVRLVPPVRVKAYIKRGRKNDAADAAAICEAVTRPSCGLCPSRRWRNRKRWCCTGGAICSSSNAPSCVIRFAVIWRSSASLLPKGMPASIPCWRS